jgi:hypothetical protein
MNKQRGIAITYILIFIALATLAAMEVSMMSRGSKQAAVNDAAKTTVLDQWRLIRGRIIACAINYPGGNNGTAYRVRYPAATTPVAVSTLTCPGQTGANNIWSGTGGLTLPAAPSMFNAWTYVNDTTSMRITISANNASNPTGPNATRSGSTLTIVLMV